MVKGRQVVCFTYLFGLLTIPLWFKTRQVTKKKKEARGKIGGRAGGWRWPTLGGLVLGCVWWGETGGVGTGRTDYDYRPVGRAVCVASAGTGPQ